MQVGQPGARQEHTLLVAVQGESPEIRAQQKACIQQLFKRGVLAGREIRMSVSQGNEVIRLGEIIYQKMSARPCVATLLGEGRPVRFRSAAEVYLGIGPVTGGHSRSDQIRIRNMGSEAQPRDQQSLWQDMGEQTLQLSSLYSANTPAPPNPAVGTESPGPRGDNQPICPQDYLSDHELMTPGYRKKDYQCIFIQLPVGLDCLHDRLKYKCLFEQELGIPELPLAFYDPRRGAITEIVFVSEFGITWDNLPKLEGNMDNLRRFVESTGSQTLTKVLFQLPPARLLAFLQGQAADIAPVPLVIPPTPYREDLLAAVKRGDLDRVRFCRREGASLTAPYRYKPQEKSENLLEILLGVSGMPPVGAFTDEEAQRRAKRTELGKLLYDSGCRVPVTNLVVERLPALAAYMISNGERCSRLHFLTNLFESLLTYLDRHIIEAGEFATIIKGIKRDFANRLDDLVHGYTALLNQLVTIRDVVVSFEIPDINHNSKSRPVSVAEKFRAMIAVFTPLHIVADTDVLKKDLRSCGNSERARQISQQKDDISKLPELDASILSIIGGHRGRRRLTVQEQNLLKHELMKLSLFANTDSSDIGVKESAVPMSKAQDLAVHFMDGDLDAAQALVERLYAHRLACINDKEKAVEALYQELEQLQSGPGFQEAIVELERCRSEAQWRVNLVSNGSTGQSEAFDWLRALFRFAPDTSGKNYLELAQLAIDHYYRMPHPNQVEGLAVGEALPELMRRKHGVDHVTRTQILAEALLELFARHEPNMATLLAQHPDLQELIPLAMVYRDLSAEVEAKAERERHAADCFQRDMIGSGRYRAEDIALVATALGNKDSDVPGQQRDIGRILRLADGIDRIRSTHIPTGWKQRRDIPNRSSFDVTLLDLPENISVGLAGDIKALLEGAKDLAYVTGGMPPSDHSNTGSYLQHHRLLASKARNNWQKLKVSLATNAYQFVQTILADNVRRAIAQLAGLATCEADHAQEFLHLGSSHPSCLQERQGRAMLTAIHNEVELGQIQLPKGMTVAQKLMFAHQGMACLPETIKTEIEQEVARLREHGIRPPQGVQASGYTGKRAEHEGHSESIDEKRVC